MKVFAFFIAFVILSLSILPCADEKAITNTVSVTNVIAKAVPQQQDSHQDDCSPFCQCSCCGSVSIHYAELFEVVNAFAHKSEMGHVPFNIIKISFSIWQPPKSC